MAGIWWTTSPSEEVLMNRISTIDGWLFPRPHPSLPVCVGEGGEAPGRSYTPGGGLSPEGAQDRQNRFMWRLARAIRAGDLPVPTRSPASGGRLLRDGCQVGDLLRIRLLFLHKPTVSGY